MDKFTSACIQMQNTFPILAEKLKEELQQEVMTCPEEQVQALRLKYQFLEELEQLIKNTGATQ